MYCYLTPFPPLYCYPLCTVISPLPPLPVMADEEVDQLIAECKPEYALEPDGTRKGKISFEQYRTMLLDKGVFNEVSE